MHIKKIVFTNDKINEKNILAFKNIKQFFSWLKKNTSELLDIELLSQNETNINDVINLISFWTYYLNIKNECEKTMIKYNESLKLDDDHYFIKDAIDKFIKTNQGGKYLRSLLISLSNNENYLPLAIAYETFQTSILIHDDIIDNGDKRRNRLTIHKKYEKELSRKSETPEKENISKSLALCIGDLGLHFANKLIIEAYKDSPNLVSILSLYNDIVIKTIKGEIIDVIAPFKEKYEKINNLEETILDIYKFKTSYYTVVGPYLLGNSLNNIDTPKEVVEAMLDIGIAYQIKDDILGIYGKNIGKSTESDILEYKQTILYSYAKNTKYKNELLNNYGKPGKVKEIKEIFKKSGAKKYAEDTLDILLKKSKEIIESYDIINKEIVLGLLTFLEIREN